MSAPDIDWTAVWEEVETRVGYVTYYEIDADDVDRIPDAFKQLVRDAVERQLRGQVYA